MTIVREMTVGDFANNFGIPLDAIGELHRCDGSMQQTLRNVLSGDAGKTLNGSPFDRDTFIASVLAVCTYAHFSKHDSDDVIPLLVQIEASELETEETTRLINDACAMLNMTGVRVHMGKLHDIGPDTQVHAVMELIKHMDPVHIMLITRYLLREG